MGVSCVEEVLVLAMRQDTGDCNSMDEAHPAIRARREGDANKNARTEDAESTKNMAWWAIMMAKIVCDRR